GYADQIVLNARIDPTIFKKTEQELKFERDVAEARATAQLSVYLNSLAQATPYELDNWRERAFIGEMIEILRKRPQERESNIKLLADYAREHRNSIGTRALVYFVLIRGTSDEQWHRQFVELAYETGADQLKAIPRSVFMDVARQSGLLSLAEKTQYLC